MLNYQRALQQKQKQEHDMDALPSPVTHHGKHPRLKKAMVVRHWEWWIPFVERLRNHFHLK